MFRLITLFFTCIFSVFSYGQPIKASLKTGDLLFQNLDCGPLCDAIEKVTDGYKGNKFSHIGLVYISNDSVYIIEAIGKNVHLTPLAQFTARSSNQIMVGRLKKENNLLIPTAIRYALSQQGTQYDDAFIYDNGKYYCSELIYDALKHANNEQPFFELQPMTFKDPETNDFSPAWTDYYKELKMGIPEGEPGINPGGISLSDKIDILN